MEELVMKEQYTEIEWLDDLYNTSNSDRTVTVARTSLKTFDLFCQSQDMSRDEMVTRYQKWFKPEKNSENEQDIQSICISLSKCCKFMNEDHEEIQTSNDNARGGVKTFKKKSPKTIKLYFGFMKSYLRKCHGIRLTIDDIRDYVSFPKQRKDQRQPITLDQLKQIMTNCNPSRRALYYVLVTSGMRIGEALTLTRKNFRFSERPVRVVLEAENTKTKESRETYITSEAFEKLKLLLGDIVNHPEDCDCVKCNEQFFNILKTSVHQAVSYEDQYFGKLRAKLGFTKKYPNSIRYVTNIHSMRAYFITKASQKNGSDYGHALSGHGSYLKQYIRIPQEEQAKLYLDLEPELLIESVKVESKDKEKKIVALEQIVEQLQDKMLRIELLNQ
jgi:integrase